jgi:glycosyltransferase involved in cell wall biosynthesis
MRILLIDDRIPDPHFGAGFPRAYRMLMILLDLGHEIYFMPTKKDNLKEVNTSLLRQYGIEPVDDLHKLTNIHVAILSRPHNVHYQLPIVRQLFPHAKVIYDTEALWFRRYDLQLEITGRLPKWAYRYDELNLARQMDLCFSVNDNEKSIMESNGVRWVVKLGHALDIHREGKSFAERKDFLVVGGILEEDSSNEDGLWWYLENAWGVVHEKSHAELDVTGLITSLRLITHSYKAMNTLGHVKDLVPVYESRRVFVAATRFATGIPWKVHEAMAHGIPCVVSRLLDNQLQSRDGELLVADTPAEFIAKSLQLYEDQSLWERIREGGFALVKRDCDPVIFKKILSESLEKLVGGLK